MVPATLLHPAGQGVSGEVKLDALVPTPTVLPVQGHAQAVPTEMGVAATDSASDVVGRLPGGMAEDTEALVCSYSWDCQTALRIVQCESGWDSQAVGRHGERGLFQISPIHAWRWPTFWSEWMIPEVNVRWAYELWAEQGWGIWACN